MGCRASKLEYEAVGRQSRPSTTRASRHHPARQEDDRRCFSAGGDNRRQSRHQNKNKSENLFNYKDDLLDCFNDDEDSNSSCVGKFSQSDLIHLRNNVRKTSKSLSSPLINNFENNKYENTDIKSTDVELFKDFLFHSPQEEFVDETIYIPSNLTLDSLIRSESEVQTEVAVFLGSLSSAEKEIDHSSLQTTTTKTGLSTMDESLSWETKVRHEDSTKMMKDNFQNDKLDDASGNENKFEFQKTPNDKIISSAIKCSIPLNSKISSEFNRSTKPVASDKDKDFTLSESLLEDKNTNIKIQDENITNTKSAGSSYPDSTSSFGQCPVSVVTRFQVKNSSSSNSSQQTSSTTSESCSAESKLKNGVNQYRDPNVFEEYLNRISGHRSQPVRFDCPNNCYDDLLRHRGSIIRNKSNENQNDQTEKFILSRSLTADQDQLT